MPAPRSTPLSLAGSAAAVLSLAIPLGGAALASDYMNICRSADGLYEIDDGTLRRTSGDSEMAPIAFRKVRETVLSSETGYCLSKRGGEQRFHYEARSSALRARFTDLGHSHEVDFICEFAADGLPAAYDCDTRVVTSTSSAGGEGRPASVWLHNGSTMRLEASGAGRSFYYVAPRSGIMKAGAKPGTLLFRGERNGDEYTGTAYIFSAGCPPQPYAVAGQVSGDDRRIVMTGKAPRIGAGCVVTGYRDDTLVFTFQPAGE